MDLLLQRVLGRATLLTPTSGRDRVDRAPRWAVNGALWLLLLLVPGSLLLLPVLLWWKARPGPMTAPGPARCMAESDSSSYYP